MYLFDCCEYVCVCVYIYMYIYIYMECLCMGTLGILLLCLIDLHTCVDFAVACPVAQVLKACQNG